LAEPGDLFEVAADRVGVRPRRSTRRGRHTVDQRLIAARADLDSDQRVSITAPGEGRAPMAGQYGLATRGGGHPTILPLTTPPKRATPAEIVNSAPVPGVATTTKAVIRKVGPLRQPRSRVRHLTDHAATSPRGRGVSS
jgi:hypothetical protein